MKIAVYGATGAIGSAIVEEARSRGHEVTGISRRGSETPGDLTGDALDADFTTGVAEKHDVIVSAIGPSRVEDDGTRFVDSVANLIATLGGRRLLVVGGVSSLKIDGVRILDLTKYTEEYRAEATKGVEAYELLLRMSTGPTCHRRC